MQYPETQVFLYNVLLSKLIDDGDYKNVRIKNGFNLYIRIG
jgi:hypothetical protein